ncbi:MAG: hypothetical protein WC947_09625 [Elusimicrobiota bacterium]
MKTFNIPDGQYGQIFCMKIDMLGSEFTFNNIDPDKRRVLLNQYLLIVDEEVKKMNGIRGAWQGDGGIAIIGTQGEESDVMRSGEEMSRAILDRLLKEIPDKRFRIGIACEPGRFFNKIEILDNRGIIFASRIEPLGRQFSDGSVLLCPSYIYSALNEEVKKLYTDSNYNHGETKIYIYIPKNGGNYIPYTPPQESKGETTRENEPEDFDIGPFEEEIDKSAPFFKKPDLYFSYIICPYPRKLEDYSPRDKKDWILKEFLSLPIGTPIFEGKDDIRNNQYTLYVAEKSDSEYIQMCKFYPDKTFAFIDGGWSKFPGWAGVFHPESLRRPLRQISDFTYKYYNECLHYDGDVVIYIGFKNIAGRIRKISSERIPLLNSFTYDRNISAKKELKAKDINSKNTLKFLYDKIIKESNLDPETFGWDSM